MNTTDLRRGNLILTSKDAGGNKFLRSIVEEIKSDSIVVDGERAVMIADCAGIPLTEEWLLKFGFEKSSDGKFYKDSRFTIYQRGVYFGLIGGSLSWNEFKYVHQLQNLYYVLTGEDLSPAL